MPLYKDPEGNRHWIDDKYYEYLLPPGSEWVSDKDEIVVVKDDEKQG